LEIIGVVEEKAINALHELLDQPLKLRAMPEFKRNGTSVEFWIEPGRRREDVLRGQGGSVANMLRIALRMFTLTTLDQKEHHRFVVLDEQVCCLRSTLVPRLFKFIRGAGEALRFEVPIISYHNRARFGRYADKIYELVPRIGGVRLGYGRWVDSPRRRTALSEWKRGRRFVSLTALCQLAQESCGLISFAAV